MMRRLVRFLNKPFLSPYDVFGYGLAFQLYQEHGLLTAIVGWTAFAIFVPAICTGILRSGGHSLDD